MSCVGHYFGWRLRILEDKKHSLILKKVIKREREKKKQSIKYSKHDFTLQHRQVCESVCS